MLVEHEDEGGGCLCGLRMRMRLGFMIEGVWLSMMLGYVGSGLCVYHEEWGLMMEHEDGLCGWVYIKRHGLGWGWVMWVEHEGSVRRLGMWGKHEGHCMQAYGWSIGLNMRVGGKMMVVYVGAARGGGMWVEHDGGVCGWCMRSHYDAGGAPMHPSGTTGMNRGKPGLHRKRPATYGAAPGTTGTASPRHSYGNAPVNAVRKTGALPERHRYSPGLRRGITDDDQALSGSDAGKDTGRCRLSPGLSRGTTGDNRGYAGTLPVSPGHYRRQPRLCRGFTGINPNLYGPGLYRQKLLKVINFTPTITVFCGHVVVVVYLHAYVDEPLPDL
ncbi:hypothetical protein DPMN_042932 [Dreissena polymorpha]|uniref:Uncharacterized protein n=1 Tax=Dreissena polymorpha TaxID=45954 RepID=A0A9D4D1X1_DREPO|nr:hypothetical protein DPMN_042932 [Dreissena polymorpha]